MRRNFGLLVLLLAAIPCGQIAYAQEFPAKPSSLQPPPVLLRPLPSTGRPQQILPSEPLRPIMKTHTMPPYPPESFAAEEQGTSVVEVHITTAGTVDNCLVFQSSGFARLDQAACDHIQNVWRWQAPTLNGEPVNVSTRVSVKWDIKNGPPPQ